MKVFFDEKQAVTIAYNPFSLKKMKKQDIADYLMGLHDNGNLVLYNSAINERQLMMSYLPFIHTISFCKYFTDIDLEKNQLEITFESSSLSKPSPVILEVSDEMYNFLYNREEEGKK